MSVEEIIGERLTERRSEIHSEFRIWEKKSFNIHRGVVYWQLGETKLNYSQMSQRILELVRESFRVSWWRGFAFGVVIESPVIPADFKQIMDDIDIRSKFSATWQWTVLACLEPEVTVGIHTWTEGYLTPTYRGLIDYYETQGFQVGSVKKDKDAILKFLTSFSHVHIPEFDP